MSLSIIDLHSDLLSFLAESSEHTPFDERSRCSIAQMREGGVKLQVLPLFTETEDPLRIKKSEAQAQSFNHLIQKYFNYFRRISNKEDFEESDQRIGIIPAVENASSLFLEEEPLQEGFLRLEKLGKLAYVSLTWNTENRFGGGAHTKLGLKPCGKELLLFLASKNIPVDLSHASDRLADQILEFTHERSLNIPLMASHSNFRNVCASPRNLPDPIAKEIGRRKGLIGFNFIRSFVGSNPISSFSEQLSHALELGLDDSLSFGADFFHDGCMSPKYRRPQDAYYFPGFDSASCYPKVIDIWINTLKVSPALVEKICYKNAQTFFYEQILAPAHTSCDSSWDPLRTVDRHTY